MAIVSVWRLYDVTADCISASDKPFGAILGISKSNAINAIPKIIYPTWNL